MKSKRILTLLAGIVLVSQAGFALDIFKDLDNLSPDSFISEDFNKVVEKIKVAKVKEGAIVKADEAKKVLTAKETEYKKIQEEAKKANDELAEARKKLVETAKQEATDQADLGAKVNEAEKNAEDANQKLTDAKNELDSAKVASNKAEEKASKVKEEKAKLTEELRKTSIASVGAVEKVQEEVKEVVKEVKTTTATNAALAGLHPMQFDPLQKTQVMAAVGAYRDAQAVAVGLTHYVNENFMLSGSIAGGGSKFRPAGNLGFTWKIGSKEDRAKLPSRYQAGPVSSIYRLQAEVDRLIRENIEMKKIIKENREMREILDQLIVK